MLFNEAGISKTFGVTLLLHPNSGLEPSANGSVGVQEEEEE